MKTKIKTTWMFLAAAAAVALTSTIMFIASCSKEATVEAIGNNISTGNDTINMLGTGNTWTLDKVHSNTNWESLYYGANSLLNGKFNNFWTQIYFEQAHPEKTIIHSWVQLSTFNTGESGRDAYTRTPYKIGCGLASMGCLFDTTSSTIAPRAANDTAYFNSTTTVAWGSGYKTTGNLIFHGFTKPIDLYWNYSGITAYPSTSGGATAYKCGFTGQFGMLQKTDWGVNSASIADLVTVKIHYNCKKL